MLISHRKKFIYTKTIKTAGTSVESYFEQYCMPEGDWTASHERAEYSSAEGIIGYRGRYPKGKTWLNHMSAAAIKQQIGEDTWDGYYKFCVVRNPFTKLVSAYHHFVDRKRSPTLREKLSKQIRRVKTGKTDPADLVTGNTHPERFQSWIKHGGWVNDRNKYFIDDQVCVDYFILQEDLGNGVKAVCQTLQIPYQPDHLPKLKARKSVKKLPTHEYYNPETIAIVQQRYAYEIEKFGYSLPKP